MSKQIIKIICGIFIVSLLSGCKFVREIELEGLNIEKNQSDEIIGEDKNQPLPVTENPVSIVVDKAGAFDAEGVYEYFFGQSKEELLKEECFRMEYSQHGMDWCEYNGIDFKYYYENEDSNENCGFYMQVEGFEAYDNALKFRFFNNEISACLMHLFPEEELETASSNEAIIACASLAEACGYSSANVTVYAMKHEILNNYLEESHISVQMSSQELIDFTGKLITAPGGGEWKDEHDAYVLVYRPILNGRLLDSIYYHLLCVYVPSYGGIVYAEANQSLILTETLEESELITQEAALEEVLRILNIKNSNEITIKNISIVYSPRYDQANETLERRIIDPCWRIDYEIAEDTRKQFAGQYYDDDGTILINAIDGKENQYPRSY